MSLPSGTVTFLFTDIEGSTKLAQEHPDEMPSLLARHHAILHKAIETQGGYVFQIVGDSFSAAFHSAGDALNAALSAQRSLQDEAWNPAPIRVRMGIHTGAAQLNEEKQYSGYATLALTQRIMSAGHGGQILVSGATRELVRDALPENTELKDLGEKRLKDLHHPEHIYQLNIAGLRTNFPALKTPDVLSTNLPMQLSTFIGREKEMGQIKQRLKKNRLVTLTGSGGVGKTRLSIQVATELLSAYPNGVWLVELAPITDPALVIQTVCAVLDVTPQGNTSPLAVLTDYLYSKKLLLVVDNCEHLIDACAQLCDSLLHTCPNLRIIASSREALGIDGENAYRVPSLSLADPKDNLQTIKQAEAVRLFVERASTILPEYAITEKNAPTIAQICQRLDGVALAVELAASRVKTLKVDQIAARLDDTFRLLTGGSRTALPRQQTLRGTIDWSYNLLAEEERMLLRRLSVFVGGWTLEAAEAVCEEPNALDLLTRLVDKSLVSIDREHHGEPRYFLLETIRQYAREKLKDSGEGAQIRARHLEYFLQWVQKEEHKIYGDGQVEWVQNLEADHENLNVALEWSLQGDRNAGQQLISSLWWAWHESGHNSKTIHWLERMLAATPEEASLAKARLLSGIGWLAEKLEHREEANQKSVDMFRRLGDETGAAFPLCTLGICAYYRSDYEKTIRMVEESLGLFEANGNQWGIRHVMGILGYTAEAQGNFVQAQEYYERSLSMSKELGDLDGIGWTLYLMGNLADLQNDASQAMKLYEEALATERLVKFKPVSSWVLNRIGILSLQGGDYERAKFCFEESLEINQKTGDRTGVAFSLGNLGWCARLQGDFPTARSYYAAGLRLMKQTGNNEDIAGQLVDIGILLGVQGHLEDFVRLLGLAVGQFPNILRTFFRFSRIETEQYIETARNALSNEAYNTAYNAGKQMTLDEGVAYVLKELGQ